MSTERSIDRVAKCAYYRQKHALACRVRALEQAKADKSDPHTFNRVLSHLLNGPAELDDYGVEWQAVQKRTAQGAEYALMVPINMRRP